MVWSPPPDSDGGAAASGEYLPIDPSRSSGGSAGVRRTPGEKSSRLGHGHSFKWGHLMTQFWVSSSPLLPRLLLLLGAVLSQRRSGAPHSEMALPRCSASGPLSLEGGGHPDCSTRARQRIAAFLTAPSSSFLQPANKCSCGGCLHKRTQELSVR